MLSNKDLFKQVAQIATQHKFKELYKFPSDIQTLPSSNKTLKLSVSILAKKDIIMKIENTRQWLTRVHYNIKLPSSKPTTLPIEYFTAYLKDITGFCWYTELDILFLQLVDTEIIIPIDSKLLKFMNFVTGSRCILDPITTLITMESNFTVPVCI